MDNIKRASLAAIISVKCGVFPNSNTIIVYDYTQSKYFNYYLNDADDNHFSIYDYDRGNYIQGPLSSLFDYYTSTYMSLSLNGNSFEGYDYQTNSFITGSVNDKTISIYDYQTSSYHYYFRT